MPTEADSPAPALGRDRVLEKYLLCGISGGDWSMRKSVRGRVYVGVYVHIGHGVACGLIEIREREGCRGGETDTEQGPATGVETETAKLWQ